MKGDRDMVSEGGKLRITDGAGRSVYAQPGDGEGCLDVHVPDSVVSLTREQQRELGTFLLDQAMGPLPSLEADGYAWPGEAQSILQEAHGHVYGDRQGDYGHPREDFTRTAIIWTGLLHHKLAEGAYIEAEDVPRCMIGVKLSRDVHSPKRDNRVDMAGYALTLDRLETGK